MKDVYVKSIIIILISLSSFNCTVKYYDANKLINDYKTEGFLDWDHYQVIITGMPSKEAKGLVAQRESALSSARSAMNNIILESLAAYVLNYHINKSQIKNINNILNIADVKKNLLTQMQTFLQYGYIAFEYYNMDNSVTLVYRIFKEDLIDKIESAKPGFNLKPVIADKNLTNSSY